MHAPPLWYYYYYYSSSSDQFNDWEGRGCNNFFPVSGGNGTEITPTGDMFDESPGQMR